MVLRYAYPSYTLADEITLASRKHSRSRYLNESDDENGDDEADFLDDQYPRRIITRGFYRHREAPEKVQTHDTALTFLKK